MSMSVGNTSSSGEPEVMMDINTTPLIDVMLVLLIMLIITIPIQLHAVNLDLPVGTPPQQNVLIVKIDIDERNKVFFNGELMPDTVEVDRRLRDMSLLPLAAQPELHLRPNKRSRYETVVAVMAAVQRFGLTKFGIVGAEQFIE